MTTPRLLRLVMLMLLLLCLFAACGGAAPTPTPAPAQGSATVEVVKLNAHPSTLAGKTVVLRWNSKPNGDKFLTRVAEQLQQQAPGVNVIKLWEQDPSTAVITEDQAESEALAAKVAQLKPDLVIASQAD